jgi:hypothetical protein
MQKRAVRYAYRTFIIDVAVLLQGKIEEFGIE